MKINFKVTYTEAEMLELCVKDVNERFPEMLGKGHFEASTSYPYREFVVEFVQNEPEIEPDLVGFATESEGEK